MPCGSSVSRALGTCSHLLAVLAKKTRCGACFQPIHSEKGFVFGVAGARLGDTDGEEAAQPDPQGLGGAPGKKGRSRAAEPQKASDMVCCLASKVQGLRSWISCVRKRAQLLALPRPWPQSCQRT